MISEYLWSSIYIVAIDYPNDEIKDKKVRKSVEKSLEKVRLNEVYFTNDSNTDITGFASWHTTEVPEKVRQIEEAINVYGKVQAEILKSD